MLRPLACLLIWTAAVGASFAQTPDDFNLNVSGQVYGLALQPDGKILIGGSFGSLGGVTRTRIARLNPDGSIDTSFNPNANNTVYGISVQPDGKILVGGDFTTISGVSRNRIARLNPDGSLDPSFNPNAGGSVYGMAIQADGRVVVGGSFTTIGGVSRNRIARLDVDGTLDVGFNPNANGTVNGVAVQADGRILVWGNHTNIGGSVRNRIARLNADGSLDPGFNPNANGQVNAVAVQVDGKVVVGGGFSFISGASRGGLARINADGTLDPGFNPNVFATVHTLALQVDGRIVVGGDFYTVGGVSRNNIARVNADGTLDADFNPNANSPVIGIALQPDGRILAWGGFTTIGGASRNGIARLTNDVESIQALNVIGGTEIQWLRQGSAPEVEHVTFDRWNGTDWLHLGGAERIPGGWRKEGLTLTASTWIRARARTGCGQYNGSSGMVEQIATYGSGSLPDIVVSVDGTVLESGNSTVDFGDVRWPHPGAPRIFTITNVGDAPLNGLAASMSGADASYFQISDPAATTLAPGASTTFSVQLSPPVAGASQAVLSLVSSDGDESPFIVNCKGTCSQLEQEFNPDVSVANFWGVNCMAVQPDGRILVGGDFGSIGGVVRSGIARLNPDGSVDPDFNPNPSLNGSVYGMAVQPDGKIILVGSFIAKPGGTFGGGGFHVDITRLNQDGSYDTGFTPGHVDGTGLEELVRSVAVQPDGKILIGGSFTSIDGIARNNAARLNADGTLDAGFNPNLNNRAFGVAVQPDGKSLVWGEFTNVGGVTRNRIARLNVDGTLDAGFNPNAGSGGVMSLVTLPDGKILAGGGFNTIGGVSRSYIARLHPNGSVDTGFNANAGAVVYSIAVQADGKILTGGYFTEMGGVTRKRMARLHADGTLDPVFNPDANDGVHAIAIQPDGRILIGGKFSTISGITRNGLARLPNDMAPSRALSVAGSSQIDWILGGSSPQVEQVAFDTWSGSEWVSQGSAVFAAGVWRLTGLSLPSSTWVRARARALGGQYNASSSIIEHIEFFGAAPAPDIRISVDDVVQESGVSTVDFGTLDWNSAGEPKTFAITNLGNAPLSDLDVTGTGDGAGDFIVTTPGRSELLAGESTTLTVTFSPKGGGVRSLRLSIASNDMDDSPFHIGCVGKGIHQDPGFDPGVKYGQVYSIVTQADGKIVVGGNFSIIGGMTRNRIARLYPDGTPDAGFDPNANGEVNGLAVQPDGKILVAGDFTMISGVSRNRIARLNPDGSLDLGFNPNANNIVEGLAVQNDAKILVWGWFTSMTGVTRNRIARLHPDGSLDSGFNPNASGRVYSLALRPDGKMIVGGWFENVGGLYHQGLLRLNADGSFDRDFDSRSNRIDLIQTVAAQPDGKVIVSGRFKTASGSTYERIARLNENGTLDSSFVWHECNQVSTMALQTDGRILVGGSFPVIGGVDRSSIARLNTDGTVDPGFDPRAMGGVQCITVQPDGRILVGGLFTGIGGVLRNGIARLPNDGPATQSLAVTGGNRIEWSRGGCGPEVERVQFDRWDGASWVSQGAASPVTGGWEKTGLSLPGSGWVRARGWISGGQQNGGRGVVGQIARYGGGAFPDIQVTRDGAPMVSGYSVVDFGAVGWRASGEPVSFTITNAGDAPLSGLSVSITGTSAGDFVPVQPGVASLAPGESTTFSVRFSPRRAGSRFATLEIASNDGDGSPFTILCSGTGRHDDFEFNPGLNQNVQSLALEPGGRILIGGGFTAVGGVTRNRIARLNADGTLDAGFDPGTDGAVYSLVLQPDGKVLATGSFTAIGGQTRNRIARLNRDGTLDPTFNPDANSTVYGTVLQTDGKIIVWGSFTTMGGIGRNRICRLNTDGTLDSSFDPNANSSVYSLGLQPDGRIIVAGPFTSISGVTRNRVARLNADGTLDSTFNPDANGLVNCIGVQPDGRILAGGIFTSIGGVARNRVARVNADGTLDAGFNPDADGIVNGMALQADGSIIVCGDFSTIGGVARNRVARLEPGGSVDPDFDPNANSTVRGIALQPDGRILLVGYFGTLGGEAHRGIARLHNTESVQSLSIAGTSQIDWYRSGTAPEVQQVIFEEWNGGDWVSHGAATRVAGGWSMTGLALPASGWIRARGRMISGEFNCSSGIVEEIISYGGAAVPGITVESEGGHVLDSGADPIDFGSLIVGEVSAREFTIRNTGTADLTGISVSVDGQALAGFSTGAPGVNILSPGESTAFTVTFAPSGATASTASIRIESNDLDDSPFVIRLAGAGYHVPGMAVEQPVGTAHGFGAVYSFGSTPPGVGVSKAFVVRNTGLATLNLGIMSVSGANQGDFLLTAAGTSFSLPPGGQTTLLVVFNPSSGGEKSAVLSIPTNLPSGSPFLLNLSGSGTDGRQRFDDVIGDAGLSGEDALPEATPFDDGVSNLLKYAFNMNMGGPDTHAMSPGGSSGLPASGLVEVDGETYLRVEFVRRKGSGLVYQPVKTADLSVGSFAPLSASPFVESIDSNWERVTYDEPCSPGDEPRCFTRVQVSLP